jgi:hypothetical protein
MRLSLSTAGGPLLLAAGEFIVGLGLIAFAKLNTPPNQPETAVLRLLADVGLGLVAAGFLTATLEPISRHRLQRDIDEIKTAHFESLLKGLMPEAIFEEIREHVIRQTFERTDWRANIELGWVDAERTHLRKEQSVTYIVRNRGLTTDQFELRVIQEKVHEDLYPGCTELVSVKVEHLIGARSTRKQRPDDDYMGDKLAESCKHTPAKLECHIPIPLASGETVQVTVQTRSIIGGRNILPLVVTHSTVGWEMTVAHPEDLEVTAIRLHPSTEAMRMLHDTPRMKHWQVHGGLLPFQGVQLRCLPSRGTETPASSRVPEP